MREQLHLATNTARETGQLLMSHYGAVGDIRDKQSRAIEHRTGNALRDPDYDPITAADREADAFLKERLTTAFPDYGWLSEETADSPKRLERSGAWIVDPIDGTKEFIDQIGEFVTSIALVEDGVPIIAVIYNPVTDELFSAIQNGGCFLNGKRVFSTDTIRLDRAAMIVSRSEAARGEIDHLRSRLGEVRPVGSIAYKLAVVASGGADLNISVQPKNEWDVCAGDLLVREAGGQMVDLYGQVRVYNQPDPLIMPGLVAGNEALCSQVLNLAGERK